MSPDRIPPEWFSAYIDDELEPSERAAVEARLDHDPAAVAHLRDLRSIRDALAALPEVEPPATPTYQPVAGSEARPTPRRGVLILAAAAVVAVVIGVVAAVNWRSDATDQGDMPQLLALHRDAERMMDETSSDGPGDLEPVSGSAEMPDRPDDLGGGMVRMGAYGDTDLTQLIYSDGSHVVSVFEQPKELAGPMEGDPMELGDREAMHQSVDDAEVLTVADDGMVLTIVSGGDLESLTAMAGAVVAA